jgi:hypothetical protein
MCLVKAFKELVFDALLHTYSAVCRACLARVLVYAVLGVFGGLLDICVVEDERGGFVAELEDGFFVRMGFAEAIWVARPVRVEPVKDRARTFICLAKAGWIAR